MMTDFHIGAQNDAFFIVVGEKPAMNNDFPVHNADRTVVAKVYDEELCRELVELQTRLRDEEERHAQLQSRCFDQGGQSVFDQVKALRAEIAGQKAVIDAVWVSCNDDEASDWSRRCSIHQTVETYLAESAA